MKKKESHLQKRAVVCIVLREATGWTSGIFLGHQFSLKTLGLKKKVGATDNFLKSLSYTGFHYKVTSLSMACKIACDLTR